MASVEDFVGSPSEELLELCTKEQLLGIAAHYDIGVSASRLKDSVKAVLREGLFELGVLVPEDAGKSPVKVSSIGLPQSPGASQLTFAQQKELILLQFERAKLDAQLEGERQRLEQERLRLEVYRLDLIRDGNLGREAPLPVHGSHVSGSFDVGKCLRILLKFNEKDPDTFFSLFEHVAGARGWFDDDRNLLL